MCGLMTNVRLTATARYWLCPNVLKCETGSFPQHADSGALCMGSHQTLLPLSVAEDAGAMSGGQDGARLGEQ